MNALVLTDTDGSLALREVPEPGTAPGTVLVALHAAALNRRDYWITQGLYPGITAPCTLASPLTLGSKTASSAAFPASDSALRTTSAAWRYSSRRTLRRSSLVRCFHWTAATSR